MIIVMIDSHRFLVENSECFNIPSGILVFVSAQYRKDCRTKKKITEVQQGHRKYSEIYTHIYKYQAWSGLNWSKRVWQGSGSGTGCQAPQGAGLGCWVLLGWEQTGVLI